MNVLGSPSSYAKPPRVFPATSQKVVDTTASGSSRAFLSIAAGSASEAEYQLLLAHDLDYIGKDSHHSLDAQVNEIKRMLNSFIQKLKANC